MELDFKNFNRNNIFQQILEYDRENQIIFKSRYWVLVRDKFPFTRYHYLLISRFRAITSLDVPLKVWSEVFKIQSTMHSIFSSRGTLGFRILVNGMPEGGQQVPHLHVHLMFL